MLESLECNRLSLQQKEKFSVTHTLYIIMLNHKLHVLPLRVPILTIPVSLMNNTLDVQKGHLP